jgi:uncharacterized membrane protein YczE
MIEPPTLRGSTATRVAVLIAASCVIALGVVLLIDSGLGAAPWDVLNQGIAQNTPLSFGAANVTTASAALLVSAALGAQIRISSAANALTVGGVADLLLRTHALGHQHITSLPERIALVLTGTATIALGSALYLATRLGPGPRDAPMLALAARTRHRLGPTRAALESTVVVAGIALGATAGPGTVIFALTIGPAIELTMTLLAKTPLARYARTSRPGNTGSRTAHADRLIG